MDENKTSDQIDNDIETRRELERLQLEYIRNSEARVKDEHAANMRYYEMMASDNAPEAKRNWQLWICAQSAMEGLLFDGEGRTCTSAALAESAYDIAEAMMAERAKREAKGSP